MSDNNDSIQTKNKREQKPPLSNENSDAYIADRFPPDLKFAEKHGIAKRVAKPTPPDRENPNIDLCDCCGLPTKNEPIPLCCSSMDLAFLGPGFPLYFQFIVYIAFILGLMISVEGIYNIISNYAQGNGCDDTSETCTSSNINRISLANKFNDPSLYQIQCWVNFGCAVAILISLHIFRRIQRTTITKCDEGLLSPSDFSIMISQIHSKDYTEEEIRKLLTDFWDTLPKTDDERNRGLPIKKIVFTYNIGEFVETIRKKNALLLQKRKALAYQKKNNAFPPDFNEEDNDREYKKISELIEKYEKEAEKGIWKEKCGVVVVSFNTKADRENFYERCTLTPVQKFMLKLKMFICCKQQPENFLFFKGKFLIVEIAPEPNDILWENLHYCTKYKVKVRIVIYSFALLMLAICFGIILGISFGQTQAALDVKQKSYNLQVGVSILGVVVSFVIVFINVSLSIVLKMFGNLEKHSTLTHLKISNAIKLSCAQFFNTAILILVVKLITLHNEPKNKIFSSGYNLSSDLVSIFTTNAILVPLMNILNPFYFAKLATRRKIRKEGDSCLMTQAEANVVFEGGEIDLSVKYASLMKTVWLSGFYITVTPIGCFISFFGVIVFYFVEKYLLLNRISRPPLISSDLNDEMLEFLEYVPLSMGVGSLIFHFILFDPTKNDILPDLLTIALSVINFILPSEKLNECLFPSEGEDKDNTTYDAARIQFPTDYDRANPVTQEAAIMEWVNLIEKHKGITLNYEKKFNPLLSINTDGKTQNDSDGRMNNCLINYANANLQKINNMIAQAPANINTTNNILPFYNIMQQQGISCLPSTFSNFLNINPNNLVKPQFISNDSPEIMPLINPNSIPIKNVNFGAYPPQQNQDPSFNYPKIYPPNSIPTPPANNQLPPYNNQNEMYPNMNIGYAPNVNTGYNPNINSEYNPNSNVNPVYNSNPGYIPNPIVNPGYNPNIDPNLNPGYNPNINPEYIPNVDPGYNPNIDPGYNPNNNDPGYNPNLNVGYNPYTPNIDPYNYNSEVSNRGHNFPPQTYTPNNEYGNYQ